MSRILVLISDRRELARMAVGEILHAIPDADFLLVEYGEPLGSETPARAPVLLGSKAAPGSSFTWRALLEHPRVRHHPATGSSENTRRAIRAFEPDLGIALGAGSTDPSIADVPRLGTINLRSILHPRSVPWRAFETWRGVELEAERIYIGALIEAARRLLRGEPIAEADTSPAKNFQPAPPPSTLHVDPTLRRWIKTAFYEGYARLAQALPRRFHAMRRAQRLTVFCYHRVNDDVRDPLTVGVAQFEAQMRLLAHEYPVVSIEDVVAGTFSRDTSRPAIAVTFDDGYLDNWEFAAPILIRLGIPAAFFVTTGLIGTDVGFDHDRARIGGTFPLMTWDQLRRLRDLGFTIGSHASTHINFALADPETLRQNLIRSRDTLRQEVGVDRPLIAYPYGRRDDITAEGLALVRRLGFSGCLSAYGGTNVGPIDPFHIRRQGVGYAMTLGGFRASAEGFHRSYGHHRGPTPASWEAASAPVSVNAPRPTTTSLDRSAPGTSRRAQEGSPPLIAHVIYHLLMGGLENGLVNLVNRIPLSRYRHAIVCMAFYDDFRRRITRPDVELYAMHVEERGLNRVSSDLFALFHRIRPAIVHSRNPAGLDGLLPAFLAGVRCRIHGEHGWETDDLHGTNRKNLWNRRLHQPLVHRYVALSKHQERYLVERVGIPARRVTQIYNGVDVERFRPRGPDEWGRRDGRVIIGTVGRMQDVKDPLNLVEAFLWLRRQRPDLAPRIRLAMIGDGALRGAVETRLREGGAWDAASLPGAREDVAEQLRALDVFVLPSKAEGISNTILEAMATGLPVVATKVGGNPELVDAERTGILAPAADPAALGAALLRYVEDPALASRHGAAGRVRAVADFSLDRMVASYTALYDAGIRGGAVPELAPASST